jgi:hypothetical protein
MGSQHELVRGDHMKHYHERPITADEKVILALVETWSEAVALRAAAFLNSWQTATYKALAEHGDFCAGGFDDI